MRGPGRVVTGGVHWGVRSVCAEGAAASRPALQGFRRAQRQRVVARAEEAGWVGVCLPGAGGGHRVRTAAARAECGMWAAWARVEGATLQGFEDRGTTLSLSLSLSLPLTTWHPSLMPLDRTQNAASARGC